MADSPDLIIVNGALITFDPGLETAQALAITGGKISAVGSTPDIRALAGPDTTVFDAAGGTVLPGFIDSHVHLFGGSVELSALDLYGVNGIEALTNAVRPYAAASPEDALVFCVQADYDILGTGHTLTRHDLDQVLPDRPLAMFAPDHHTIWANTAALKAAGLLQGGKVDAGSEIVMGKDGLASGELLEPGAYAPILEMTRHAGREMLGLVTGANPSPPATASEREMDKDVIALGLKHCATQGITSLHNMDGNTYQLDLLRELETEGRLLCRVEVPFHLKGTDPISRLSEAAEMRTRYKGDKIWCNRVKMFIDGVIDSGTALMLQPYPGSDDNLGDEVFTQAHFQAACVEIDRMGMQIAVHAIGDAGVRRTLDAFEAAISANGKRDSRHRIEHLEVVHPDDIPRIAQLGAVASIQPGHAPQGRIFPPTGIGKVLHDHQIPCAFAWQDIRDTGARVIFSTDWPVIPVDVMLSVRAAIAPLDLGAPWRDQTQSLRDTLASYTRDNAWVEFNEDRKGRLKAGMMADVVVMSHNLETLDPMSITDASAVLTVCDGAVTYQAP
jgi:predicted amidohydrolase YtcJ